MNTKLLVACLFLSGCGSIQGPVSSLPAPTGKFSVGTRILAPQVDTSRPDSRFVRNARTLNVQLWYPTSSVRGPRSPYVPDAALLDAIQSAAKAPEKIEPWRTLFTHAVLDAPRSPGTFPLLLFSPGFGMARSYYTTWIEELTSHGYIVAAVDHPFAGVARIDGRVFTEQPHPDGPGAQADEMAVDLSFLLTSLAREAGVDPRRLAAIGHSIGGAAALEACRRDLRLVTCVNLDGAAFGSYSTAGVHRPFLVVHQQPVFPDAKPDGKLAQMGREIEEEWKGIIAKQSVPALRLSVRGTGHFSFSDAPFIRPELVTDGGGVLSDPLIVLRSTAGVIDAYLTNAFDRHPERVPSLPELIQLARLGG